MSRSGYSEDYDQWANIRWRGAVNSAIKGKRGQDFLKELLTALEAMPVKRLIANDLQTESGEFCTLGVLGASRGIDMENINPSDSETVSSEFNIADALAREIVFWNDEGHYETETPENRWNRMRNWVADQITIKAQAPHE